MKNHRIAFKVTKEEKELINIVAGTQEKKASQYCREIVLPTAKKDLTKNSILNPTWKLELERIRKKLKGGK